MENKEKLNLNLHVVMDREVDKTNWNQKVSSYLQELGIDYLGSSEVSESPRPTGEEELESLLGGWVSNPTVIKRILEIHREQLSQAREESRESVVAELGISENMEKIEGFFREAPMDYDDKCNLWYDFLKRLLN